MVPDDRDSEGKISCAALKALMETFSETYKYYSNVIFQRYLFQKAKKTSKSISQQGTKFAYEDFEKDVQGRLTIC